MSEVPCALTATATVAMARKSLENIFFLEGRFWGRKEIEVIGGEPDFVAPLGATLYHSE